ncbi:hypothetical protein NHX12_025751 [Muraenolepis orangiensis]|uniref:Small integral membrane protein 8 n=1 Tax=Muraenolepis orangiensis TaxID=630683 RepID=A0A9Q0EG97_9TELE|nr:hypothetical protein NHX12_025751 [Muraenolepis orangiensis]
MKHGCANIATIRTVKRESMIDRLCANRLIDSRHLDMSSSADSGGTDGPKKDGPRAPVRREEYRVPGLRGVRTTTLFRAVNPELFVKPNKPVMALGLLSITLCVGYLGYLHAVKDNQTTLYEATDSEGEKYMRRKTSRWD